MPVISGGDMGELRLNFTNVQALVVDRDQYSSTLTRQMLRGFGVRSQLYAKTGEEAQEILQNNAIDLCLIDADLPDMSGYALVRWLRRREEAEVRFLPVLILAGYTQLRNVAASRDCGANCVVSKPFSPRTMFDHIAWSAASKRPYLESAKYIGPDRRFRDEDDAPRRRMTDTIEAQDDDDAPDSSERRETA